MSERDNCRFLGCLIYVKHRRALIAAYRALRKAGVHAYSASAAITAALAVFEDIYEQTERLYGRVEAARAAR